MNCSRVSPSLCVSPLAVSIPEPMNVQCFNIGPVCSFPASKRSSRLRGSSCFLRVVRNFNKRRNSPFGARRFAPGAGPEFAFRFVSSPAPYVLSRRPRQPSTDWGSSGSCGKDIRLTDGDHDIDCKIDGIGAMGLKSEFVKKA